MVAAHAHDLLGPKPSAAGFTRTVTAPTCQRPAQLAEGSGMCASGGGVDNTVVRGTHRATAGEGRLDGLLGRQLLRDPADPHLPAYTSYFILCTKHTTLNHIVRVSYVKPQSCRSEQSTYLWARGRTVWASSIFLPISWSMGPGLSIERE
jgi:hypothetical protein